MAYDEIMEELASIRSDLGRIESQIALGSGFFEVFSSGLESFRRKSIAHLRELNAQQLWQVRFQADADLRYPHRKILECLLRHFNDATRDFDELCFSDLVRNARVSKSRAKQLLIVLEAKGYIRRRDTGYRTYYRIESAGGQTIKNDEG